ncbi:MAG: transcriptional regulator, partial [Anaeromyxobacteraceae bacterium]
MATPRDLLTELAVLGVAQPATLRAALRVSPATLSRLIAAAGEDVYRFGKTRSLRYARTRSIEGLGRRVPAFRIDEAGVPAPAGTIQLLSGSRVAWEDLRGASRVYEGLPPALVDMAPQGYLGRGFPQRFPELRLPQRIDDWTDDHRLIALGRRGEDCVGNLVVGSESLERFLRPARGEVDQADYQALARASAADLAGSSAGGERPKFGALRREQQVLVKFQPLDVDAAARRWRDLLWCEWKALETVAAAGRPAARAALLDADGWR